MVTSGTQESKMVMLLEAPGFLEAAVRGQGWSHSCLGNPQARLKHFVMSEDVQHSLYFFNPFSSSSFFFPQTGPERFSPLIFFAPGFASWSRRLFCSNTFLSAFSWGFQGHKSLIIFLATFSTATDMRDDKQPHSAEWTNKPNNL